MMRIKLKPQVSESPKQRKPYRAGFLAELNDDQCRFVIHDENHLMCGAKTIASKAWCDSHNSLVYK